MIHFECFNRWMLASIGLALIVGTVTAAESVQPQKPSPRIGPGELGRDVDPFIGTGGKVYLCGNNFPGATVPFGMVRLSPDTVPLIDRIVNTSGYYYSERKVLGFSHTRLAGTGATEGGNFRVIPTTDASVKQVRHGLRAVYDHEDETAFPGYYGVHMRRLGITAELTAARHVGVHRYTFPAGQSPHLLIHVSSVLGKGQTRMAEVKALADQREIEGSIQTFGTFSNRYGGLTAYFVARLDRPIRDIKIWNGKLDVVGDTAALGTDVGVDLTFDPVDVRQSIGLKVGMSYVSVANARANLDHEAGDADFDQIVTKAVQEWEETLSRIRVTGGTQKQRMIFRTALYRAFQMPTIFSDVNGDYLGFDGQVHQAQGFDYYTDMSLWDTFRTVHPLYNLIAPREQRDMLVSLIKMAEQGGGVSLPRWPAGGGESNSMFGTPADIVVTESYLKGIRDFDVQAAYRIMRKAALTPVPDGSKFSGRHGIQHYLKYQYCPADLMKKSVASTIEYSYADHRLARLAAELGHEDDAKLFLEHAGYYRNLWNPETQFFQPRKADGTFSTDFQPELLTYFDPYGTFTHAYVEGSAWQWRWGVPADADQLIPLFKSRESFVQELATFFEKSSETHGSGVNAFYWHGNQPDLYAAFLFNHAGRPDLTQKWVRWILETKYSDHEDGLDGNDDGGTLSAWYVLGSIGLFPTAGTERYELTSPIWDQVQIQRPGQPLTITTTNAAAENQYIQQVSLEERELPQRQLNHADLKPGGTLRFDLGPSPVSAPEANRK